MMNRAYDYHVIVPCVAHLYFLIMMQLSTARIQISNPVQPGFCSWVYWLLRLSYILQYKCATQGTMP